MQKKIKDDTIYRQAAIEVDGLDEEIRCEMCKNPMHTDRGCDGYCKYDEILYEKIIQILNKRITPLPSARPEPLTCHGCKHDNEWYEGCKTCIRLLSYKTDNYEEEHT